MPGEPRRVRRVVTGNDAQGRSRVVWDGEAPMDWQSSAGNTRAGIRDMWVFYESPAPLSLDRDDGQARFNLMAPEQGGHFRLGYSPARGPNFVAPPLHEPERRPQGGWSRGGPGVHKTPTLDYAVVLGGDPVLWLDDGEYQLHKGDVVIQCAAWHGWRGPADMAYIMVRADTGDE